MREKIGNKIVFKVCSIVFAVILINLWFCTHEPKGRLNPYDPSGECYTDSVIVKIMKFVSMTPGVACSISGTITTSPKIDEAGIMIAIQKDGTDVINNFAIVRNDISALNRIDLFDDLGLLITPNSTIAHDTYMLIISAFAGIAKGRDSIIFVIPPDLLIIDETLGSWNSATYGASLDADSFNVYKIAQASVLCAEIDIWYSNEVDGGNVFYSPRYAAIALHEPKNWSIQNETKMTLVNVNFDLIIKQAQVDSLWTTIPDSNKKQMLRLQPNDVFILETNKANKRLIQFIHGDGTNTGSAYIKGKM